MKKEGERERGRKGGRGYLVPEGIEKVRQGCIRKCIKDVILLIITILGIEYKATCQHPNLTDTNMLDINYYSMYACLASAPGRQVFWQGKRNGMMYLFLFHFIASSQIAVQ